ncbi:hypothetical protein COX27_00185 [Candidatus Kuenenbacteria bacterium CG23_combo_of_CG06-09_8_20_14_all_36_9]|uniref:Uncharacterized protein n=1 Tax=Candidatus Kuenenbacteria bacterium CG10_big_fil_rev_8_21_14_0_10_36_11 TaxID=1974618 RepID=A0A2M6WAC1_9BACT|nr:MAG: hypothetical protein COX27_00185 [Candidatus Kuenenbacteria bacterium CG23_combo_of_CG06-09_8_20_14_all_36_9]PIT89717.1 MAG: hypothetical protein COU23_02435 [Candidatus Kuenenbacteria bacterium CG10_big_fil_rev_8_21_14_0_10_36_11]
MENIDFNNLATKEDLKSEIDKVRQDMATKDDLKAIRNDLSKVFVELDTKIDQKTEALFEMIGDFKNEMLENFDKQGKILEKLDSETAAHSTSYQEHKETLDQHEEILDDHE